MIYKYRLNMDGSSTCLNCYSNIRVHTDEVYELHKIKCEEWAKMRQEL
jgi:hypothetical protein